MKKILHGYKVADITLEIYGGAFVIMSPQSKYWGDVSPLSHRDRRPWGNLIKSVRWKPIFHSVCGPDATWRLSIEVWD